jgi:integrase
MAKRRGHGEGAIYYREDRKRWVASIDLGWENGKRRRRDLYGRTRREVAEKLARALQAQHEGRELPPERTMVGPFLDDWLENVVKPRVRHLTYVAYESTIRLHLKPTLEKKRLVRLTPADVQKLLNAKSNEGLGPRKVREIRGVLRTALNQALKWGLVSRNMAALTDPPKVEAYEGTALTVDQAKAFIAACRGDRLEALYIIALGLGLRQGEALGIRWEDVDLDGGVLRLRKQVQRVDGKLQLVDLKTRRSRRTLPLPPFAIAALREHRTRQREERMHAGPAWQTTGAVFTTQIGTLLDARNVTRWFTALRTSVKDLPAFTFHDTRRTCSSLLLALNVHPRVVMEILGHTQISLTMETYTQVVPDLMKEAFERLDTALGGE